MSRSSSPQRLQTFLPLFIFLLNLIDNGRGRAAMRPRNNDPGGQDHFDQELPARTQAVVRGPGPGADQFQPGLDEKEYVLDLNNLSNDNIVEQLQHLASALSTCGFDGQLQKLRLHHVTNRSVTCNDGSPAGYYLRKSYESKKWLIFLEGGFYCFDTESCRNRYNQSINQMSSRAWPQTKTGSGVMSADPEENPIWWKSNVVFIPYCSSDVWTGRSLASETGTYSFMGADILQQVLTDLLSEGLMDAKQLVLAGSSAGGTGVLLNLDRVASMMDEAGSTAKVVGLADSGWFLDTEPLGNTQADCILDLYCNPARTLQRGTKLWNSLVPETCLNSYTEKWKCFYGFRIHQSLKTPVYIFQWLYDEVQLTINMQGPPIEARHWHYMQKVGRQMRGSLRNATTVFAPACYAHNVLRRSDWSNIKVRDVKLYKSLQCWLKGQEEPRQSPSNSNRQPGRQNQQAVSSTVIPPREGSRRYETPSSQTADVDVDGVVENMDERTTSRITTTDSTTVTSKKKRTRRRNKKGRRHRRPRTTSIPRQLIEDVPVSSTEASSSSNREDGRERRRGGRGGRGKRDGRGNIDFVDRLSRLGTGGLDEGEAGESRRASGKKCVNRLVDHATCPHCNPTCPKMTNPRTGEDMELLSFMQLFGFKISALAEQLGIDERTLALVDPEAGLRMIAVASKKKGGN
ncbi:palmitoleoyl-protein carboxylesterase NOTUM-like isoform X1 [Lytechinus pictus]|uniref:palmitoleoyl-protein carboxylesterase NOTUM-like isoform X1 n=1 Tax=Lytechinus pictus TaxID=7653 RepID=UPI0030BA1FFD